MWNFFELGERKIYQRGEWKKKSQEGWVAHKV